MEKLYGNSKRAYKLPPVHKLYDLLQNFKSVPKVEVFFLLCSSSILLIKKDRVYETSIKRKSTLHVYQRPQIMKKFFF